MTSAGRWYGELPSGWTESRVGWLVDLINGYPFNSELFGDEGFPLVRIRDLGSSESEVHYSGDFLDAAAILPGDVLIGMDGDFNVGRWNGPLPALLNQRVCLLRGEDYVTRFLEFALPIPLKRINDLTYATTVKHLSSGQVLRTWMPVPEDKAHLQAIVDFLDRETAQIDAMVRTQEQLVAVLHERRAAVIDEVVVSGLATGRGSQPLAETGAVIPGHWRQGQLKRFARVQSGLTKNTALNNATDGLVEVPYLRVANVQDGLVDLSELQTIWVPEALIHRYLLRKGDVLMNEGGDNDKLGRGAVWDGSVAPCVHQNHVFVVRTLDGLLPEWLSYFNQGRVARNHFASHAVQSTNLASISARNLLRLPIGVPPFAEQVDLVAHLDKAVSSINGMITKTQESIALMKERRTAVISAAVTGRLDVRTGVEQIERELEEARA